MIFFLLLACRESKETESRHEPKQEDTALLPEPSPSEPAESDTAPEEPSEEPQDLDGDGFIDSEDCDDQDSDRQPQLAEWELPLQRCGLGSPLLIIEDSSGWESELLSGGELEISNTPAAGCSGTALQLSWSLDGSEEQSSAVAIHALQEPVELTAEEFLIFPFRAESHTGAAATLTLTLEDELGCQASAELEDSSTLPTWRPALLPKGNFIGSCSLSWSNISKLTLRISLESGSGSGTLLIDDLTAINPEELSPHTATHFYCPPLNNSIGRGSLAAALLNHQQNHLQSNGTALLPSWMEENPIRYYSYDQALALILFSMEFRRTGQDLYANAATSLADQLLSLPRSSSGAWYDVYDGALEPLDPAPPSPLSVGWMTIAYHQYIASILPPEVLSYKEAVRSGGEYLKLKQSSFGMSNPAFEGALQEHTDGNLAAYFGLIAANRQHPQESYDYNAGQIADLLLNELWDPTAQRLRGAIQDDGLDASAAGGWGTQFLRHVGEREKALYNNNFAAKMMSIATWDDEKSGVSDRKGPWQPSWEYTGIYAAAGGPNLEPYLNNALDIANGGLLPAHQDSFQGAGVWHTSWHGVAPTAWIYFGLSGGFLDKM